MGANVFGLRIKAETVGEEQVARLETALNKALASSQKLNEKTKQSANEGAAAFSSFGQKIKQGFSDPVGVATSELEGLALKAGVAGAAIGGTVTALALAGAATFELARRTGALAEQQTNQAARLGVTIQQYGVLSQASKAAGLDSESLVGTMKGLSQALATGSEEGGKGARALRSLGIESKNAFGNVRPINDLLLDIADKLGGIQNPAERAEKSIAIFGKRGLEVLPLMTRELRGSVAELTAMGVGFTAEEAKTSRRFDDMMDRWEARMEAFRKRQGGAWARFWLLASGDPETVNETKEQQAGAEASRLAYQRAAAQTLRGRTEVIPVPVRGGGTTLSYNFIPAPQANVDPFGLVRPRPIGASVTSEDLNAQLLQSKRIQTISSLDQETQLRDRLKREQSDLTLAIENGDRAEAIRSTRAIKGIETEIRMLEKLKQLRQQDEPLSGGLRTEYGRIFSRDSARTLFPGQDRRRNMLNARALGESDLNALNAADLQYGLYQVQSGAYFREESTAGRGARSLQALSESRTGSKSDALLQLQLDQQALDNQARKIQLLLGPSGEANAVRIITQMKLDALEKEKAVTEDLFSYQQKRNQILADQELQLLEIRRRGQDAYRGAVQAGFSSLLSGGQSGISSFLRSQGTGLLSTVAGNVADLTYKPGRLSLGTSIVGTAASPTFLGKLLKGTPFGADPAAGIQLTAADIQLTAAKLQMQAAAGGAMGGFSGLGLGNGFSMGDIPSIGGGLYGWGNPGIKGPSRASQFFGGLFSAPMSGNPLGAIFSPSGTSVQTGAGTATTYTGAERAGIAVGTAGALVAGGYGVYSGIKMGGGKGALTAIGSAAGTAAMLDPEPISKAILGAIALGAGIGTLLFGDPKKKKAEAMQSYVDSHSFTEPVGVDYLSDLSGNSIDYDYRGRPRTYRITQNVTINAIDAATFDDYAKRNSTAIAGAVTHAVMGGQADDLVGAMNQR